MSNDDMTVRSDAAKQPYYADDSSKTKRTDANDTNKSFKKVYDKGAKKASENKSIEEEGEETDAVSDEEKEGSPEKVFSLFSPPKEAKLGKQQFGQSDQGTQLAMGQTKSPVPVPDANVDSPFKTGKEDETTKENIFQSQLVKNAPNPLAQTIVPVKTPLRQALRSSGDSESAGKGKVKGESKADSSGSIAATQTKGNSSVNQLGADAEESAFSGEDEGRAFAKKTTVNPFVREQGDISAVNPQASIFSQEITASGKAEKAPAAPSATVAALVEQMIKELSIMETSGKTETSILLKNPPMLDGAQLILTGFDSAHGELNIKFANLTQQAQAVINQQQHSLMSALETKGYQVHIFIATTVNEPQIITAGEQPADRERQQREGQQGQRSYKDQERG